MDRDTDIRRNKKDASDFKAVAISANSNVKMILERIEEFKPKYAVISEEPKAEELKSLLPKECTTEVFRNGRA